MIQYILVMLLYIPFSVIGQINNTEFQSATLQCLTSTCTPEDQQLALSLQQQQCSTINKKY